MVKVVTVTVSSRDRPIMLIFSPIMLCCSAQKFYLYNIIMLKIMLKNKNCA